MILNYRQALEIKKLQKEIETMKTKLNDLETTSKQKDEVIANLNDALDKQRDKAELVKTMMEWKLKKMDTSREKFTNKLAERFYEQKLKSKMLLNWNMMVTKRNKKEIETAGKRTEKACLLLAAKYEQKIKTVIER